MARQFGSSAVYRPQGSQNKVIMLLVGGGCLLLGISIILVASTGKGPETQVRTVVIETPPEIELVDVLVPIQPIDTGTEFMPDMFKVEQKPRVAVSSGVISSFQQIQGQFAKSPIMADQPLSAKLVTRVRPITVISANIPEGFRAVTIPVDQRTGVEGWAKPGARVDVSWTSSRNGRSLVTTIVYNAKVLSAGGRPTSNPNEGPGAVSTVTLLVTDEDAAKIQLAQTAGTLSLSLRGDTDTGAPTGTDRVLTLDDLYGLPKDSPVVRKKLGCVKVKRPQGGHDTMCLGEEGNLEPVE